MSSATEVKRSFEQRAKRLGLEIRGNVIAVTNTFIQFQNLPFWIWDRDKHEQEYDRCVANLYSKKGSEKVACCFNHAIGLPQKNGEYKPLFDYEKEILDAIGAHRHVWIKKATGLGVTEFMLRYIAWRCLFDNQWAGSQVGIVTGPNIDLAKTLIKRLKGLFPDHTFEDRQEVLELNGVHIEAFPSNHLDAMRGLEKPVFIFMDEADFFPVGQWQDARDVSERYIAKSNPIIVLISTPNAPEGLFESIEREPDDICLYHRLFMDYTVGLNKIYSPAEIASARESPSFEREYNLKYIGQVGNVFSAKSIEAAIKLGEELEQERMGAIPQTSQKVMGIDAGYGSSKFGIVVTQLVRGFVEVVYAEEYDRPDFGEMIDKIIEICRNFSRVSKIYVDDANPELIRALKYAYGERQDYHDEIKRLKARNQPIERWMDIIPISFRAEHKEMLAHLKYMLDKESFAVSPKFSKLIVSLRTAIAREGALDKTATSHDDLLDALRLSLKFYHVPTGKVEEVMA